MRLLEFKTSVDAFNGINAYMIFNETGVTKNGIVSSSQTIMYDTFVKIHRSWVPEDWDFTSTVNYRPAKWSSLVNNYIDKSHLQEILAEVQLRELKKATSYNIAFHFANSHGGGKGCLLTCTFSRRPGLSSPILVISTRASEVYKRLMVDLLLIHRIGQEAYGEEADFGVQLVIPHAWQGVSWAAMWRSWQDVDIMGNWLEYYGGEHGKFADAVWKRMNDLKTKDWSKFSYNADKRAAKVIQKVVAKPALLAGDCYI
jgi:hypothetical protein